MLEKEFQFCYGRMLKGIEVYNSLALQTQNFSYTDPFLFDRILEIER